MDFCNITLNIKCLIKRSHVFCISNVKPSINYLLIFFSLNCNQSSVINVIFSVYSPAPTSESRLKTRCPLDIKGVRCGRLRRYSPVRPTDYPEAARRILRFVNNFANSTGILFEIVLILSSFKLLSETEKDFKDEQRDDLIFFSVCFSK